MQQIAGYSQDAFEAVSAAVPDAGVKCSCFVVDFIFVFEGSISRGVTQKTLERPGNA